MRTLIITIITLAVVYCGFAFFFYTFDPQAWGEGGRAAYILCSLICLWAALAINFISTDK